jgi:ComF family protein
MPGRHNLKYLARIGQGALVSLEILLLPPICAVNGCYAKRWRNLPLCLNCIRRLQRFPKMVCNRCGLPDCRSEHKDWEFSSHSLHSLFYFNNELASIIHGLKYRAFKKYGRFLSSFLRYYPHIISRIKACDMLLPVPLHYLRQRERGYNQSLAIAQCLSAICSVPVCARGLKRIKNTSTQTRLSEKQRIENMKNAFIANKNVPIKGKMVCLIDDVFTTGATTEACARVLIRAGASEIRIFTLARAKKNNDINDYELELQLAGAFLT